MNCGRKDTYGVYAEPVDPEEVFGKFSFFVVYGNVVLKPILVVVLNFFKIISGHCSFRIITK